jgi:hypothetical protein
MLNLQTACSVPLILARPVVQYGANATTYTNFDIQNTGFLLKIPEYRKNIKNA